MNPISSISSQTPHTGMQPNVISLEVALEAINTPITTSTQPVITSPVLQLSEVIPTTPSNSVGRETKTLNFGDLSYFFQLNLTHLSQEFSKENYEFLTFQLDQLMQMFPNGKCDRVAAISAYLNFIIACKPPFQVLAADIGLIFRSLDTGQGVALDLLIQQSLKQKSATLCGFIRGLWEEEIEDFKKLKVKIPGQGTHEMVLRFVDLIIDRRGDIHFGGIQTVLCLLDSSFGKQFGSEHFAQMRKILENLCKDDQFQKEVQQSHAPHPDFADEIRICLRLPITEGVDAICLRRAILFSLLIGIHQSNYQGNCPVISSLIHQLHKKPHEIYSMTAILLSKGTVALNTLDFSVPLLPLWNRRPKDYRAMQTLISSADLLSSELFRTALNCVGVKIESHTLPPYGSVLFYINQILPEDEKNRKKEIVIGMLTNGQSLRLHQILSMAIEFAVDNNPNASKKRSIIELAMECANGSLKKQLNPMDPDVSVKRQAIDTVTTQGEHRLNEVLWLQRMENPRVSIIGGSLYVDGGQKIDAYKKQNRNLDLNEVIPLFSSHYSFLGKSSDGNMINLATIAKVEEYIKDILKLPGFGKLLELIVNRLNSYSGFTFTCADLTGLPDLLLTYRGGSNEKVLREIFQVSLANESITFQSMPQFLSELFDKVKGITHDYVPIETTIGKGHCFNLTPKHFPLFLLDFTQAMTYYFYKPVKRLLKNGPLPGENFKTQSTAEEWVDKIRANVPYDSKVRSAVNFNFYKLSPSFFTPEKVHEFVWRLDKQLSNKLSDCELLTPTYVHNLSALIRETEKGWDSPFHAAAYFQELFLDFTDKNIEAYDFEKLLCETFDLPFTLILGHLNWEGDVKLVVKYDFYEKKLAFYKRKPKGEVPFSQEDLKWLENLSISFPNSNSPENSATVFQLSNSLFATASAATP